MRRRRITILPIVVPIVIATFAAATTFGITRYRAPAEVGIVLAAAVGLCAAWVACLRATEAGRRVGAGVTTTTAARRRGPAEFHAPRSTRWAALRRPENRGFVRGLVLVTLIGAAVRVLNVLWWRPTTSRAGYLGYSLTGDSTYYHWQANALGEGPLVRGPFLWMNRGRDAPSAAHPPLYPLYLSVLVARSASTPSPAIAWHRPCSASSRSC